jgi:hypothetical protein
MYNVDMQDLRVMHFHDKFCQDNTLKSKGGLTVVYYWDKKSSFVAVATAVCSKSDTYNKKVGRNIASINMSFGRYVTFPFNKKVWKNPRNMLRKMFKEVVESNGFNIPLFVGKQNIDVYKWEQEGTVF